MRCGGGIIEKIFATVFQRERLAVEQAIFLYCYWFSLGFSQD